MKEVIIISDSDDDSDTGSANFGGNSEDDMSIGSEGFALNIPTFGEHEEDDRDEDKEGDVDDDDGQDEAGEDEDGAENVEWGDMVGKTWSLREGMPISKGSYTILGSEADPRLDHVMESLYKGGKRDCGMLPPIVRNGCRGVIFVINQRRAR